MFKENKGQDLLQNNIFDKQQEYSNHHLTAFLPIIIPGISAQYAKFLV